MEPTITISLSEYNYLKNENVKLNALVSRKELVITQRQVQVGNKFIEQNRVKQSKMNGIGLTVILPSSELVNLEEELGKDWLSMEEAYEHNIFMLKQEIGRLELWKE